MKVSQKIKTYRERAGLSQQEAADIMGMSPSTLCNLERGIMPTATQAHLLGQLFEVEPTEFWTPPTLKSKRTQVAS